MLKYLGHEIVGHKELATKKVIDKVDHRYYPFVADFYSKEEMKEIRTKYKYDDVFTSLLLREYYTKSNSRYDSYLQRV
jgi:hypothetical protein